MAEADPGGCDGTEDIPCAAKVISSCLALGGEAGYGMWLLEAAAEDRPDWDEVARGSGMGRESR